jgi:hypothetical protein
MNKESLVNELLDFQAIGGEISHELAAKMVKNHHDKYGVENSNSFLIGKDAIDMILSQPGCVGMCFSEAINEEGNKTLVYAGVDSNGKCIIELTSVDEKGKLAIIKGSLGDNLLPPPTSWWS